MVDRVGGGSMNASNYVASVSTLCAALLTVSYFSIDLLREELLRIRLLADVRHLPAVLKMQSETSSLAWRRCDTRHSAPSQFQVSDYYFAIGGTKGGTIFGISEIRFRVNSRPH